MKPTPRACERMGTVPFEDSQNTGISHGPRGTVPILSQARTVPELLAVSLLLLVLATAPASAAVGDAAAKVRQGIEHFQAERYDAAATAFTEAARVDPEDPRIAFDRACAYAAQGDAIKAVEFFQQAALAQNTLLSADSHYNLGNVAASQARAVFGEKPQEAPPATRQQGLKLLSEAVAHYRDCLRLAPDHADARHNLELIRLWIHHMEEVWKQRDRQNRQEKSLLEMVEELLKRQRELRSQSKELAAAPGSPDRDEAIRHVEGAQRSLIEDLKPLEEKLGETLKNPPPAGAANTGPPPAEMEKAREALSGLVDQTRQEMSHAADAMKQGDPGKAVEHQTGAIEALDQLDVAVVPFPNLVGKAIETEEDLIRRVEPAAKNEGEAEKFDYAEAAWDQGFVARWSEVLPAKAESELKQFKAVATGPTAPSGGAAGQPDPAEIKKQAAMMVKAMEKAIEVGPKVHDLTAAAVSHLEKEEATEALPKQEEALKLLKEIAELLPKQSQQQKQHSQQHSQQDQRAGENGEKEKSQPKPDQPPKPEEKKQQPSDEQKPDQQQEPPQSQQKQQKQPKPEEASKEEVEAMIRQVRDRQRQRRELERELRQGVWQAVPVDKDW